MMSPSGFCKQTAFTLVELMIVISIIGVLASIAIPQYASYTKKAKFSEVIRATAERKSAVNICAQEEGSIERCSGDGAANSHPGIPRDASPFGNYIVSISTFEGDISVVTNAELDEHTLNLDATKTQYTVTWSISGTCVAADLC